jgi:Holliday junction DNA helicase RuvB
MGIYTKTVLQGVKVVTAEMAEDYFAERGLDPIGLNKKELEILNAIKDDPKGVVSEDTLAGRVYLDVKIFKTVYEPYLNKIGFITTTSRGRELTQRAWDYLNYGYYDFGNGYSIGTNPRKENEDKE